MYSKIISIEEIFDWYLKTLDIKLDRKPIQRYIKNGIIKLSVTQKITSLITIRSFICEYTHQNFCN